MLFAAQAAILPTTEQRPPLSYESFAVQLLVLPGEELRYWLAKVLATLIRLLWAMPLAQWGGS